ncbi:carboxypeptidase-like regulatory domain-containing protein [Flavobacterium sp. MFBS3-15]|uniref:carboxypeptidase-like regulatory domain-containing protein n=1 Tax=Flavobacterium sp. MFBS3-15 TaxID=2989816 RepID=UPI00223560BA|nr:carboxypeptidase-like regulatory domain-containing protein [Flavobacterium sp. MFBS3-15]MCW4469265.1 carboxypeptidase-like regulatory domain-containing protein [Flavobacterium sp. MFBS3-15]
MVRLFFAIFCFCYCTAQAQTLSFTGVVSDTLEMPLENANVIAKPLKEGLQLKFAIADHKGRYRLELEKQVPYEITVSYLGFLDETFLLEPDAAATSHNFLLKPSSENLKEIIIDYEIKPVIVKKDTLVYDIGSFASGNERKMKDILAKLPGVEVGKDGSVTVQGKRVTQMLVEGQSFFGGGSKLAVENIPADALDKIEVIDHFTEVGFMKEVSDSEELAMNVKLKEDKKKFMFGDIEAGAGNDSFYLAHAALFYYSPKTNLSFIGDANTIGQRVFSFDDLVRFEGGRSKYLTGRKSLGNLYSFTDDNTDVVQNRAQFAALNFSHRLSDKLSVSGFGIFSKIFTGSLVESEVQYLQNDVPIVEERLFKSSNRPLLGAGNIKLDYDRGAKEKIYYNAQYQSANNDFESTLTSVINNNATVFETFRHADNNSFKQYLEWHKGYNDAHTATFVVNHAYDKNTPRNAWVTNREFLPGLIPLQEDDLYNVQQLKAVEGNSIDALVKHYWIIDNFNHLYSVIGNNLGTTALDVTERQVLTDGTVNDFSDAGFGNDVYYRLNDAYVGMEYKFKFGKLVNRPGLYYHWYHLSTHQPDNDYKLSRWLLQPQWTSEYEFNKSESLRLNYRLANSFPDAENLAERYMLQSYNAVYRGNAFLRNERYHAASLSYSKMNMYRGLVVSGSASFSKKVRTLRNEVVVQEIVSDGAVQVSQFTTPVLTGNPETRWSLSGAVQKKIYNFSVGANARLGWFEYFQTLNGLETANNRNSQDVGLSLKTAKKEWPYVSLAYAKGFSQFRSVQDTDFMTDTFEADFDYEFAPGWVVRGNYTYFNNSNTEGQESSYRIAHASVAYQVKDSPWGFELRANNLLNDRSKETSSFSDYTITNQVTYILPRVVLFTVRYKL